MRDALARMPLHRRLLPELETPREALHALPGDLVLMDATNRAVLAETRESRL